MSSVEERLAKIEMEIEQLKSKSDTHSAKDGWLKQIEGSFQGDPEFLEIAKLGQEIRDAEKSKGSS